MKHYRRRLQLSLAAAIVLTAACTLPTANVKTSNSEATESPFANARWQYKPLATVAGNLKILPETSPVALPDASPNDAVNPFEAAIEYAQDTHSFALLIWHNNQFLLEHYFPGFDAELRSESASMHKSVMALALLAAIDQGVIAGLDVSASRYLEEWRNDKRQAITIRHLLTMSSGLQPLSLEGGVSSPRYRFFTDGANARSTALGRPLTRPPGQHFSYSNADSQTLGLLLERASGMPYQEFLSTFLWQPIGAADAFVWLNEPASFPRTYSALLARPRDWLRIGLLIAGSGKLFGEQVISPQRIEELLSPSNAQDGYGLQTWLGRDRVPTRYYNEEQTGLNVKQSEAFLLDDLVFLDGIGGQRVYVSQSEGLVIVRLGKMQPDWDDAQLPNRVIRVLR